MSGTAEHEHEHEHGPERLFVGVSHTCCIVDPDTLAHIAVGINPEARVSALSRRRREEFPRTSGVLRLEVQNFGFVTSPLTIDVRSDNPDFTFDIDLTPLTGATLERRDVAFRTTRPGWAAVQLRFRTDSLTGDLADRDLVHLVLVCA